MSYLSASENVGFSGIPQNISEASCATQYKMAVEGVSSGSCGEVNMFLHDNSGDEQAYIHLNDNFYSKFKIDPNELYTFHDSDTIAGEITVSHTEDNFMFSDTVDVKSKLLDSPNKELDLISAFTNGEIKEEIKKEVVSNGHYPPVSKPVANYKDTKTIHTKVSKSKSQTQVKEPVRSESFSEARRLSVNSPKAQTTATASSPSTKNSINSVMLNNSKICKQSGMETFLDVFKREQGLVENSVIIKTEPSGPQPTKAAVSSPKKASTGKTPSASKSRRGRGPAVHEALQRIPAAKRAIPIPNTTWHAPGDSLFQCGPLDDKIVAFRQLESSSSDDDNTPDFDAGCGAACVEESAAESRGARLALRRAALRRHVARAHQALRLSTNHRDHRLLASLLKKQLATSGPSCRLPTQTVNHLLAMRGMPVMLTSQERRKLRESGWSGGESGRGDEAGNVASTGNPDAECLEERCTRAALAGARFCLAHVTRAPDQRLYAACAAVFAGGARCSQPLLPLHDQTPLCAEHAWKRDNYDKLSRDCRPKKVAVRKRPCPPIPRGPRRAKRRRRPPAKLRPASNVPHPEQSLSELNVCSNSSTYDSSEDTAMGALSESEYVTVASDSHELEVEVGQVPPDDILDPAVLSQIPDEAFTEFFNQAEGGSSFAESSELAAALEAVLDERVLDERVLDERGLDERELDDRLDSIDCVFTHSSHISKNKMQVPTSMPMEMSSRVPS